MAQWILPALLFGAGAGLLAFFLCRWYYRRSFDRLEDIVNGCQKEQPVTYEVMKETRQSRLENQLWQLLERTALEKETTGAERDEVTALLSDLSHQLKTPLANVVVYSEFLQDESLTEAQRRSFAAETKKQAQKMQWLIEAMLKASQLERGNVSFAAEDCFIKETVAMAVSGVYAKAAAKDICIVTEEFTDRKLWHNRKWTAEAIGNLLDNAVKYSPEKSQITIRLCPMEIYTRIEIEDQGAGIDPEEYNRIFRRFYRTKDVQTCEGSGLGLYLAQLILNKEKGYITVASTKGEGSCFSVYLLNGKSSYKL